MISHSTVGIFSYSKISGKLALFSVAKQVAAVALGLCYADAAMAVTKDITFCNRNAEAVEVASGYDAVKGGLTSRGWKSVAACSCQELYAEDLRATEVFIHVEKKGAVML